MKRGVFIIIILFVSVLLIASVSAGWIDWIKKITGKATSPVYFNVSVTVSGANKPNVTYLSPISAVTPIEENYVNVSFSVSVYDEDGVNDLNTTSVNASFNFSTAGEAVRSSGKPGSCIYVANINTTHANFTCNVTMWYWDLNGTWLVFVQATDLGTGVWATNSSTSFNVSLLKALKVSPANNLTWTSVVPAATCQNASSNLTVNNTGNYDGMIYNATAFNLIGWSQTTYEIPASNFSINITANHRCFGQTLANATTVPINSSAANRGNLSARNTSGQEELFYFMPLVPSVASQVYDTRRGGAWVVGY